MNYWKMLGGVVVGVGAVAAAPFTGGGSLLGAATLMGSLAGAGTVAAAVGAGVVGAGIGSCMDGEEEAEKRGEDNGRAKAKAEYDLELAQLAQRVELVTSKFTEQDQYFNLLIAMASVGMACAACDGDICHEEMSDINEFIAGVSNVALPEKIKNKILEVASNPPSIKTAFALASKFPSDGMGLFDEIIEIVMHADGHIHEKEHEFLASWAQLKMAA